MGKLSKIYTTKEPQCFSPDNGYIYCNAFRDQTLSVQAFEALTYYYDNYAVNENIDGSDLSKDVHKTIEDVKNTILSNLHIKKEDWEVIFTENTDSANNLAVEILGRNIGLPKNLDLREPSGSLKQDEIFYEELPYNIYINKYCSNSLILACLREARIHRMKHQFFDQKLEPEQGKMRIVAMPLIDKSLGLNWWKYFLSNIGAHRYIGERKPMEYIILDASLGGFNLFNPDQNEKMFLHPTSAVILSGYNFNCFNLGILLIRKEVLDINNYFSKLGYIGQGFIEMRGQMPIIDKHRMFETRELNIPAIFAFGAYLDSILKAKNIDFKSNRHKFFNLKRKIVQASNGYIKEVQFSSILYKLYRKLCSGSYTLNLTSDRIDMNTLYEVFNKEKIQCYLHSGKDLPFVSVDSDKLDFIQLTFDISFFDDEEVHKDLVNRISNIALTLDKE